MNRFLAGHAGGPLWRDAADSCLEQMGPLPDGANLGFLYITDDWSDEVEAVLEYFKARTGIGQWVGTLGAGVASGGVESGGVEYHRQPGLSVLVGSFPTDSFRLLPTVSAGLEDLRAELGPWYRSRERVRGVVHGDPRNNAIGDLIQELAGELPGGHLVGGLTSTRRRAYPQLAGTVTEGGLSGVLFSEEVPMVCGLTQGCTPIGPRRTVTEAESNVLVGLDNRPALEVFYEDIGELLARDLNKAAGYIYAALPQEGADSGDYLVRNLVGVNTERQVVGISQEMVPGQEVMFCRRDGNTAREDLVRMVGETLERAGRPPRGALYFSCVGRGENLFGKESNELRLVTEELGDVPLAGFFCNGEIYGSRLYGYTGVLALFL